jgi:hypothetical protein
VASLPLRLAEASIRQLRHLNGSGGGEVEAAGGGLAPRTEEGRVGAWHGDGEAGKVAAALLGAEGGRRGTGGPD